jgi:hypothetical protein
MKMAAGRALLVGVVILAARSAFAGTAYNSTTDASWFNGDNWANNPTTASDDDIYLGQGFTSLTLEGVVFDPLNDPNYAANTTYSFGTSTVTTATSRQFVTIPQLYIAGGSGSATGDIAGKLTVKSGTLTISGGSTGLGIGRPQIGTGNTSESAALVVVGGTVTTTATNGDISLSTSQTNGTPLALNQNNVLDYTNGGTITAVTKPGAGLRLAPASVATGFTFNNTVILRHTAAGTGSLNFASVSIAGNNASTGTTNNTVEFHYGGGNVSTVNVGVSGTGGNSLKITNGTATTGGGAINSLLNLVLDGAPAQTVDNRVQDLGLFKLDDSVNGTTANTAGVSTTDATKEFKDVLGNALTEGATLSATLNGTTYSWNIYYDGNIDGSTITGAGTGNDVVLIGQLFPAVAPVPEPASLGVLAIGGLALLARRRKA